LVSVEGVVYYDGQPLAEATVNFTPNNPDLRSAIGITNEEGKFTLMTLNPKDGAAPGEYIVTILKNLVDENKNVKPLIPERYGNPTKSGFTASVPQKGIKTLKFELNK
jgi:hypothetical protein